MNSAVSVVATGTLWIAILVYRRLFSCKTAWAPRAQKCNQLFFLTDCTPWVQTFQSGMNVIITKSEVHSMNTHRVQTRFTPCWYHLAWLANETAEYIWARRWLFSHDSTNSLGWYKWISHFTTHSFIMSQCSDKFYALLVSFSSTG